jgi:hypothetical protein
VSASTSLGYAHTGRATAHARPPRPRQTTSAAMGPRSDFSRQRARLQSRISICDVSSRWWVNAPDFDDPWDAGCNRVSSASSRTGTAVTSVGIDVYDKRRVGRPPWTDMDPGPVREGPRFCPIHAIHVYKTQDGPAQVEVLVLPLELTDVEVRCISGACPEVCAYTSSARTLCYNWLAPITPCALERHARVWWYTTAGEYDVCREDQRQIQ